MRFYREMSGLTQEALAQKIGPHYLRSTVSQYENGKLRDVRNPTLAVLERWVRALGNCTASDLLRLDDPYVTHGPPPLRPRAAFDHRAAGLKGAANRKARRLVKIA